MSTLQAKAQNQTAVASDATTQLIRRMRRATRKRYTAERRSVVIEGTGSNRISSSSKTKFSVDLP